MTVTARPFGAAAGPASVTRGPKVVIGLEPHERHWRDTGCVHRGEVLREESCRRCSSSVRIEVYACAIVGECTVAAKVPGLLACRRCKAIAPPQESLP